LAVASPQIQLTSCEKFTALLALHDWISGKGALCSEKKRGGNEETGKEKGERKTRNLEG